MTTTPTTVIVVGTATTTPDTMVVMTTSITIMSTGATRIRAA
jgi:hypothetical protein